jgi:hypothetical protein
MKISYTSTRPSRFALCSQTLARKSVGPSPPATQVVEATDALLGDAPDLAATTTVLAVVPTL